LDDARRKLAQSQEHHKTLEAAVESFRRRHSYALVGEFDAEASEYVFRVHVFESPPDVFALAVGDLVQNLRTALEYIAWQLVDLNNGKPGRHTGFPIFRDLDAFTKGSKGMVRGMSDAGLALIETTQPFNVRPNNPALDPLWILNELARLDRHQILHTLTATLVHGVLRATAYRDVQSLGRGRAMGDGEVVKHGAELLRIAIVPSGDHPHVTVNGTTSSTVIIESAGIEGFPDNVLLPLSIVDELWLRCKGIWDEALTLFPESYPEAAEPPAQA
jgi:hypothetical protein